MVRISGIYASNALQARRGSGHSKAKASHRAVRAGTKAGAVTVMRPDADGHLRTVGEPVRTVKRVRWDAAGLFVNPRPVEVA